jgi:gliding motility-associated-like protein
MQVRKRVLIFIIITMMFKCLTVIGQKCPKLPTDKVDASLVLNDNGKIYDTDTLVKICLNSDVKVFSNNALTNVEYWFNYEGDSIPTKNGNTLPTGKFKFLKEGTFALIQQGELGGKKTYACKVVEVLGLTLPAVIATSCTTKSLILEIPTIPDKKFDKYDIAWGDGQSSTVNKNIATVSHNYGSVQTYFITFTGKRDNLSCSSSNIFSIKPDGIPPYLPPPSIRKVELDEKGISVKLTSTASLSALILQKEVGGTYQTLSQKSGIGVNQVNTINGLDSTKQYIYKLQIVDVCSNKVESGEIYTINLKVKPEDSKNQLNWTAYPTTITNYDIISNGGVIGLVTNNLTNSYSHQNTICGQKYCYQVKAKIGGIESVSQLKCTDGKNLTTLAPITEGLVSIDNNSTINLSWKLPIGVASDEITIIKSEELTGTYSFLKKGNINQYTDFFDEKKSIQSCYKLSYADKCNNIAANSNAFCPVILTSNGKDMTWTPYEIFASPTYSMEVFDSQKNLIKTLNVNGVFSITPKPEDFTIQNLMFRVQTTSSDGRISYSNLRPLNFALKVLVPSAFTPNGDGINDTFKIYTTFLKNYSLQIFDRWGNIIFTSIDPYEEWNGKINNSPPQNSEYVYNLNVEGQDGTQLRKSGIINIIF